MPQRLMASPTNGHLLWLTELGQRNNQLVAGALGIMTRSNFAAVLLCCAFAHNTQAAEGSCAHNEMRTWVDQEEVCYHLYGPLNERWSLKNQDNLDTLEICLDTAKDSYVQRRMVCEERGESAYREDGIHRDWERYRTAYKEMTKRIQSN